MLIVGELKDKFILHVGPAEECRPFLWVCGEEPRPLPIEETMVKAQKVLQNYRCWDDHDVYDYLTRIEQEMGLV
jgi:hypothetical protein